MVLAEGIIYGLAAMIGWGLSDFFVARATKDTSALRTLVYSQTVSAVILGVVAFLFFDIPKITLNNGIVLLLLGFLFTVAFLSFYKGIEVGKLSLVSPIAAAWAMITVLLSILFLGETLGGLRAIGISLVILGTVLSAFKWHNLKDLNIWNYEKGVLFALIALFGWGIGFTVLDISVAELGWIIPVFILKASLVVYLVSYSGIKSRDISLPTGNYLPIMLIGVFEAIATAAYGFGITVGFTSLVAPISAAFPMVTVLLARVVLNEELDYNQWFGIITIISAIILLSI
ncbi:MAG: EamA family transporter [Candidatus Nanohaloarchaea archaeon]